MLYFDQIVENNGITDFITVQLWDPRSIVEAFGNVCNVCQQKKSQHNQTPLKPIISHNFLSRLAECILYIAI